MSVNLYCSLCALYDTIGVMFDFSSIKLDLSAAKRLPEQMADQIRSAICEHKIHTGDKIPSLRELARIAGVSLRVPREAVALLSGEGVLTTRRGLGTIVLNHEHHLPRMERILLVHPNGHGAYYLGVLMEETDKRLTNAGFTISRVALRKSSSGEYDFQSLRYLLSTIKFIAALVFVYDDKMLEPIIKANIPYILCTFRPIKYPGAMGRINYSHRSALPGLIRHCRKAKIKKILQVVTIPWLLDATEDFESAGFSVENISNPYPKADIGKQEEVERQTFVSLCKWIESNPLPDLIVFTDDFASRGGILALVMHGIRIPQDVNVVVWSNRHFGPIAPVSLTKMMMDPFAHAETVAKVFLSFLRTGRFLKHAQIGPVYVKGESFP